MNFRRLLPGRSWGMSAFLAVGGGGAWSLCFGREISWWLPWLALVPLVLLLSRPRAFWWGWLHGTVFWLGSMYWLPATLQTFGGLPAALAAIALVLLALFLGLGHAVFAFLGARIWRHGGALVIPALPALWVVLEWERGWAFGGFPWNLAAYAWIEVPGALPISAWIGAFGVSYLLVFANVVLARALVKRSPDLVAVAVLVPSTLMVLAGRFDGSFGQDRRARSESRQVLVLQPNSPIVTTEAEAWSHYRRLIEISEAECRQPRPEGEQALLIWPESAAWPWSYERAAHLRDDVARLDERGCDVFLGSLTTEGERYFNSALLVAGGTLAGTYSKRRLVPWGEYVPLAEVLPFIGKLARQAGNFTPGDSLALISWGSDRLGTAICYEVVFPGAVAAQVRSGATVLVTITNDAWYGDTAAPRQHLRAARFRAAENRRPMLRAALTGISGLIDSRGRMARSLGVGEQGVLRGRISGSRELTFFTRAPWLVPVLSLLLSAIAVVRACRPSHRPTAAASSGPST